MNTRQRLKEILERFEDFENDVLPEDNDPKRVWIKRISDRGIRHKSGIKPEEYLKTFLEVGREFAYATKDNSWGEFEKLFHIMALELYDCRKLMSEALQDGVVNGEDE